MSSELAGTPRPLYRWDALDPDALGPSVEAFLARLPGPVWIRVPGRDRRRTRVFSTLLHGNEPSGVRAVYGFLARREVPATDLVLTLGAVEAARTPPLFSHRALPGRRDLNRCFRAPFHGPEGETARALLDALQSARPEALVDAHNTSGAGPAYAVSVGSDPGLRTLAARFAPHLVVTDLRLGALMEALPFPAITLECGGAGDPQADRVAQECLRTLADADDLFAGAGELDLFEHPVRIELAPGALLAYAPAPQPGADLTLVPDVDRLNFGIAARGEALGWVGARGLDALRAVGGRGAADVADFLAAEDGRLVCARDVRPFMITTEPEIAASDCLFYLIPAEKPADAAPSQNSTA